MTYVLLHINEFTYLVFSGALRVFENRLFDMSSESSQIEVFRSAGYVKYSSPESYLLCRIDHAAADALSRDSVLGHVFLEMAAVKEIIPLTHQAEVLLRPVVQRAQLRVSTPRFETVWQQFTDEEILRERQDAATKFVSLFGCKQLERVDWRPVDGLYKFMLKDLGSGFNEIERRSESSELGTFEFCVRLANEHDADWRKHDPRYTNLKQIRVNELANKKLATQSFLNYSKVCIALREFEEESRIKFGYSPFSLIPFFEFYRTHSRINGINFRQVRTTLESLLSYGRLDDASDYVHMVGYSLGLEEVTPAIYFIQKDRFPMFNQTSSYPISEELKVSLPTEFLDLFALPEEPPSIDPELVPQLDPEVVPSVAMEEPSVSCDRNTAVEAVAIADLSSADTIEVSKQQPDLAEGCPPDAVSAQVPLTVLDELGGSVSPDELAESAALSEGAENSSPSSPQCDNSTSSGINEIAKDGSDMLDSSMGEDSGVDTPRYEPCEDTASSTEKNFIDPVAPIAESLDQPNKISADTTADLFNQGVNEPGRKSR
ncbi:hypothetical protein MCEMAEM21_00138 [Oxalobacteraceae bacterium]